MYIDDEGMAPDENAVDPDATLDSASVDGQEQKEWALALGGGAATGAVTGAALGGPPGAVIGAAAGTARGIVAKKVVDKVRDVRRSNDGEGPADAG